MPPPATAASVAAKTYPQDLPGRRLPPYALENIHDQFDDQVSRLFNEEQPASLDILELVADGKGLPIMLCYQLN